MVRAPWELAFMADPEEVAALRRVMWLHLGAWGLREVGDDAQLCVSELVSNVITHVGPGTPVTLAVSMSGTCLRIEVHDPDTRALPTLVAAAPDSEGGRGMALVDALADRWGVQLRHDRKVTWCELATRLTSPTGHVGRPEVLRAETLLGSYAATNRSRDSGLGRVSGGVAEEAVVDVIADVLHWLHAHGCDGDQVLDRAQMHFESEVEADSVRDR
ncbi:ATP-binding protein [Streptomyces scabiei]|uniref:ATP-binding protein n=1 Tax=Streptomyces scabiei TaxID=1930 RepID=UPI0029AE07A4|nr:ATP-binding protein [Streptomyces scabiei]MDX3524436.1 ATP-binding protein [Streptomyces scabiei]